VISLELSKVMKLKNDEIACVLDSSKGLFRETLHKSYILMKKIRRPIYLIEF
jgi:hypothetical protein